MRGDYHVHSSYCDGKDTPTDMARRAWELGMESLGFSGHSFLPFSSSWCMSPERTKAYIREVLMLKEEYRGRMPVFLGLEQDLLSGPVPEGLDYAIGSVHFVADGTGYGPVDHCREESLRLLRETFGGDRDAFAEEYFGQMCRLPSLGAQIVGHFDLLTRYDEDGPALFDPDSFRYRKAALTAVDVLAEAGMIFEINAGAMVRGRRTVPYPDSRWLVRVREKGGRILLSGDCHSAATLGDGVRLAAEYALYCGFRETWVPVGEGNLDPRPLENE